MTAYTCFTCGQAGHFAADCQWEDQLGRSLPGPPSQPPPPRAEPTEPTAEYLQQRQRLGMASSGPDVLSVPCPWCKASRYRRCLNTAIGTETDPHYARQEAAGTEQPSGRLLDMARAQVRESRLSRFAAV